MNRKKLKLYLFLAVLTCTAFAQMASMAHMLTAYGYANESLMAWVLSIVTVLMSAVFVALGVINDDRKIRWAIFSGICVLGIVEFVGNLGAGGLLMMKYMPTEFAQFFFADPAVFQRVGALLFAGFLPVIVFLSVYALAETATRLAQEPVTNSYADALLKAGASDPHMTLDHELQEILSTTGNN